jgi:hypothetical protein
MAISRLRDMSVISTPPSDRLVVRTLVTWISDDVIQEASGLGTVTAWAHGECRDVRAKRPHNRVVSTALPRVFVCARTASRDPTEHDPGAHPRAVADGADRRDGQRHGEQRLPDAIHAGL